MAICYRFHHKGVPAGQLFYWRIVVVPAYWACEMVFQPLIYTFRMKTVCAFELFHKTLSRRSIGDFF